MLERVGPNISFGKAGAEKESIYWTSAKQKSPLLTTLVPAVSTFVSAESFKLQTHIKSSLLLEDLLDGQVALVGRSGAWWKASLPDERVQGLILRYFSMECPDDEASRECSNLIEAVGLQETGDDDRCLTG
jgi:hypothetical protein